MIITQEVKIRITNKTRKIYENKENVKKDGDYFIVKISDLSLGSKSLISCKCDKCEKIKNIEYRLYIKNISNSEYFSCSNKCSYEKNKKTNLEKYGVENPKQSVKVKEKSKNNSIIKWGVEHYKKSNISKEKVKQNNLEKYGVEHYFQTEFFKKKLQEKCLKHWGENNYSKVSYIKEKTKANNLKKYGVAHPSKLEENKNKIRLKNLEKWGVSCTLNITKIRNEISNFKKNKTIEKYQNLIKNEYEILEYKNNSFYLKHKKCEKISIIKLYNLYYRIYNNICLCTECYPISEYQSIKEKEIINWIKSLNVYFSESDKTILNPKHLDIYIPSKNIAIEFNGLYWHSELYKDKNYHLDKSLKCQEQEIQLLHIWEDEWVYKKDIIKSIILNRLGLIKEKIYARQCEIRVIEDSKLVRKFLDENHIQGYSQSSIKLGLFYQNELVSLMTFGYRHTNSKKEFELIRFCNRINLNVIGSASKLFNYFKQNYHFTELISYSDFRLFDGSMYQTLGFTKQHLSKPDYFWCKDIERKHRFNFNKQKLIKEGYDPNKTEVEIMYERGYFRIFGCGQHRWIYKK